MLLEILAAAAFDGRAEQCVAQVGVGDLGSGWIAQPDSGYFRGQLCQWQWAVVEQIRHVVARQAGLVAEQPADGNGAIRLALVGMEPRADVELAQAVLQGAVERQQPELCQLQRGAGGQQFGQAADAEGGVLAGVAPAFDVGVAEAACPDQLLIIDQRQGEAGDLLDLHLLADMLLQVVDDLAVVFRIGACHRRAGRQALAAAGADQAAEEREMHCAEHGAPGSKRGVSC